MAGGGAGIGALNVQAHEPHAYTLVTVFGIRMGAAFIFATSALARRAGILPKWLANGGYAVGSVLLLVIKDFAWTGSSCSFRRGCCWSACTSSSRTFVEAGVPKFHCRRALVRIYEAPDDE